jgi:hypothetical protein
MQYTTSGHLQVRIALGLPELVSVACYPFIGGKVVQLAIALFPLGKMAVTLSFMAIHFILMWSIVVLLSRHQTPGQNHDIQRGNRCFENVVQFRYLGTTKTNKRLVQEEIKRRLNSDNS